jgi:HK97 family phage prohead protease
MTDRLEFKFAAEGLDAKTGEFAGYGAVFGNVDTHGDVIMPGAFKESLGLWKSRNALPPMKLMHGSAANPFGGTDLPIGKWKEMREDARGLYVEGKLSGMNTDRGRYNFELVQDGALSALSIGYVPVKVARNPSTQVKRSLEVLNLKEVSLVPEGSNDQALITDLKSWTEGETPTVRQFEEFLRDVGRFSKKQAAACASACAPHLRGDPEAEGDPLEQLFAAMRSAPIVDLTGE